MHPKIAKLYEVFKKLGKEIQPNTHLALRKMEKIKRAFFFYSPEIMWDGREQELIELYDQFIYATTYTNEFGHTGFSFFACSLPEFVV